MNKIDKIDKKNTCFKTHYKDTLENIKAPRKSFSKWAYWCKGNQGFHPSPCGHLDVQKQIRNCGEFYYVSNGVVGNCFLWWKKDNCEYTTEITEAKIFNRKEIEKMHSILTGQKFAWPVHFIHGRIELHIDSQNCPLTKAYKIRI